MFSYTVENGIHCCLLLTPSNRVTLRLTFLQRKYSLDITDTCYGQMLLGLPVNKLSMAEDMAYIGRFWRGVDSHQVGVNVHGHYGIACPLTKAFRTKTVVVRGERDVRCAVRHLACPDCGAEVSIPDHDSPFISGGKVG